MEQARDSITNTVTEIKENVAQQVETVKDALDWREHFKKRPVAWSVGAAGAGFFVGYGIAAVSATMMQAVMWAEFNVCGFAHWRAVQ